ncbi:uncharacterized protein [Ptychodera flava]|uniref:uncharacterized protein n=1 Tax=Ptychodera flava TaxID=63121 RepID=UPI00396A5ACB
MAAEEASGTVYAHLEAVRRATDEKQKRWPAVYDTLVQTFDIREFNKCDWNTRHDARKAIFDEQQSLVQVIVCFTDLQANGRRAVDFVKAINTCVNYEFQTIDDFVHEAKLDKHLNLFKERELSSLLDVLNVDIDEFKPHMQPASVQRLTKNIESIRTVTEYCDSQIKDDIDKTAQEHEDRVKGIADRLQGIINKLISRWQEFRTRPVTKHQSPESVGIFDGFLDAATTALSSMASAAGDVVTNFFKTEDESQGQRKKIKVETGACAEEDTTTVSDDDKEGFILLHTLIDAESNPHLESWKAAAIEESHQVKQLFYSLQALLTTVQKEPHKDQDSKDSKIAFECLDETAKLLGEYLSDVDIVTKQISGLSKKKF